MPRRCQESWLGTQAGFSTSYCHLSSFLAAGRAGGVISASAVTFDLGCREGGSQSRLGPTHWLLVGETGFKSCCPQASLIRVTLLGLEAVEGVALWLPPLVQAPRHGTSVRSSVPEPSCPHGAFAGGRGKAPHVRVV